MFATLFVGMFGNVIGKILSIVVPVLLALAVIAGIYFAGYEQASSACKADELQAALNAQKLEYASLKSQYDASQAVIDNLNANNSKLQGVSKNVTDQIQKVIKNNKACNIDTSVINLLNQARTGVTGGVKK
jgi:hypothetical protein